MQVSAKDIMDSLEKGIEEHGVLAFYEKGAPAIMDFSSIINTIRNMTMNDINMLFRELCALGYVGEQFVYNAMIAMTDFFSSNHDNININNNIVDNTIDSKMTKQEATNFKVSVNTSDSASLTSLEGLGQQRNSQNNINLNARTHNTDNILRVIQISQKHFELA